MGQAKILIVEDEPLLQQTLVRALKAPDREISCAASAMEAVRAVQASVPDVMILDLTLFEEDYFQAIRDGFDALNWLRRSLPDVSFPVIVYTANRSSKIDVQAQEIGVFRVLRKTSNFNAVLDAVCEALGVRKAA